MELLLWRWSTAVQITSALMLAVFFSVLARSVRRIEMRPFVAAWLVNLGAMLVTTVFWFAQPSSPIAFFLLRWIYFLTKTMFVILLVIGAWRFVRGRSTDRVTRVAWIVVAVCAFFAAFFFDSIDRVGIAQTASIAITLAAGAVLLAMRRAPGSAWLATGFAVRFALAAIELSAYTTHFSPVFLASHSSFDTGAEWVIALGCVLMLYGTIQQELTDSNGALLATKEVLQELVDRDPLTGLANRRMVPAVLRECYERGATILFFDLNDFKQINDHYGHHVGDESLKSFARALQSGFRPDDAVIRYGGDEFLVIAPGADPEQVLGRVETLRDRLKFEKTDGPEIRFSAGHAYLPVHGDVEAAMREADEAMYRDKAARRRRSSARMRAIEG